MDTKNKIALITGGSRGLGENIALSLAEKGIDVILTYNTKEVEAEGVLKKIEESGRTCAILQLDATRVNGFDNFVDRLKETLKSKFQATRIDFLINNAGFAHHANITATSEQQFDDLINVHLKGPFFLTQKLLSHLNDGGGIINVSTGLTRFAIPGYAAYASVKGAIETLTKYQAKELGERKIRVNSIAPGAIETDFGGGAVRDNKDLNNFVASTTALGRAGLPDDIGGVAAFLCTPHAKWINAQRIEISGGQMI